MMDTIIQYCPNMVKMEIFLLDFRRSRYSTQLTKKHIFGLINSKIKHVLLVCKDKSYFDKLTSFKNEIDAKNEKVQIIFKNLI